MEKPIEHCRHWSVVTPTYDGVEDVIEYYTIYAPVSDYVVVEADTKRQALVEAVRKLRAIGSAWMEDQDSDHASPFTGLKAERMICPHGYCHAHLEDESIKCPDMYMGDDDYCDQCTLEWDQSCEHEIFEGPVSRYGGEAKIEKYCNGCMRTEEEILTWPDQKISYAK